jgi:hypothetical protein
VRFAARTGDGEAALDAIAALLSPQGSTGEGARRTSGARTERALLGGTAIACAAACALPILLASATAGAVAGAFGLVAGAVALAAVGALLLARKFRRGAGRCSC